ncbi:hypothetical protein AAGG52_04700 [Bacillus licheniformis]
MWDECSSGHDEENIGTDLQTMVKIIFITPIGNAIISLWGLIIMSKIEEKVYCRHCKTKTNHQIVINGHGHELKHTLTQLDYDEEIDFQFFEEYAIVQCMGCDTIAF